LPECAWLGSWATRLIGALNKVKDSYNVSRLSQLGAEATLDEWDAFQQNVKKICATRERTTSALANSVLCLSFANEFRVCASAVTNDREAVV